MNSHGQISILLSIPWGRVKWAYLRESSSLCGHTESHTPCKTHLKHGHPKGMAQDFLGGDEHLPAEAAEVHAGQLMELGVHPVQALAQQICGMGRARQRDQVRVYIILALLCLSPASFPTWVTFKN